jgi:hypothetical protein
MDVKRISRPAIRRLQGELDQLERQGKIEMKNKQTQALGIIRLDLVEECRRRLEFFSHMLKDSEEHANERRRPLLDSDEASELESPQLLI